MSRDEITPTVLKVQLILTLEEAVSPRVAPPLADTTLYTFPHFSFHLIPFILCL